MTKNLSYSLLVPCYNASMYIEKFINQLTSLSVSFDEVIFYDDGSTDDTSELLRKYGYKVEKNKSNCGPGYARNRLADLSNCDYIHFHDIDDEFNPDFLKIVKANHFSDSVDVIIGFADWLDASSRIPIIKWRYNEYELLKNSLTYFITNPLGVIGVVYSKKKFTEIRGFNEDIHCWEDSDLHVRFAAQNANFKIIETVLAYSIRHDNGISKDQIWCWSCRLKFLEQYLINFNSSVDRAVFKAEIKKVQGMYISSEKYNLLSDIIKINKAYNLGGDNLKIYILYYVSKLLPDWGIKLLIKNFRKFKS